MSERRTMIAHWDSLLSDIVEDIDNGNRFETYAITGGDPLNGFAVDASGNITIADASVLDLDFDDGTDLVAGRVECRR